MLLRREVGANVIDDFADQMGSLPVPSKQNSLNIRRVTSSGLTVIVIFFAPLCSVRLMLFLLSGANSVLSSDVTKIPNLPSITCWAWLAMAHNISTDDIKMARAKTLPVTYLAVNVISINCLKIAVNIIELFINNLSKYMKKIVLRNTESANGFFNR